MVAFWRNDWPGSRLTTPWAGLVDTVLVVAASAVLTIAGQTIVERSDIRAVFQASPGPGAPATFPATLALVGAAFTAMLQLSLVCERWPLGDIGRLRSGIAALAVSWTVGTGAYFLLVNLDAVPAAERAAAGLRNPGGPIAGPGFGSALIAVGVWQAVFFIALRGWPVNTITRRSRRLLAGNALVLGLAALQVATGDQGLLEEALTAARRAVRLTPDTSNELPVYLVTLSGQLAGWYMATADRRFLEEAVSAARRAETLTPDASNRRPVCLDTLATRLEELYSAAGDLELLAEAVRMARRAVELSPAGSATLPTRLNNLSGRLTELHKATRDLSALEEAVQTARQAIDLTPATSPQLPVRLSNLASLLADLGTADGDRSLLEESVAAARRAVQLTPGTSAELPITLNNLAFDLINLYAATGDQALVEEAERLLGQIKGAGPWETVTILGTRARIARATPPAPRQYQQAADFLETSQEAFRSEQQRLASDSRRLRDLAYRLNGLLSDLSANLALAGRAGRAIDVLEAPRIWLRPPPPRAADGLETGDAVVWIVFSQWETVTITRHGSADPVVARIPIDRREFAFAIGAVLGATRNRRASGPDRIRAFDRLLELTEAVTSTFPDSRRLLLIPQGLAAQLPYAGARSSDGHHLIDHTALSMAPSLAWAQAARRPRPAASSFAAFHAGEEPFRLDLSGDREMFVELLGGQVLEDPLAAEVLARFSSATQVAHLSCHGSYDHAKPFNSSLHLRDPLTLEAVIRHGSAPWLTNLSACETAIPDLQASEEAISFPTGLLLGGASHVLANLWVIGNARATALNRAFYGHLKAGSHPAEALRLAQIALCDSLISDSGQRAVTASRDQAPVHSSHAFWWSAFAHYGSPW